MVEGLWGVEGGIWRVVCCVVYFQPGRTRAANTIIMWFLKGHG